ncbi:MAG: hypothetical protein AAF587_17490 [Bacteroidota bacterium]
MYSQFHTSIRHLLLPTLLMIFVLAGNSTVVFSQDVKEDLKKINQAYEAHKSFRADVTYKLFGSLSGNTPIETVSGTIRNQDQYQYSKISGLETLINGKYAVLVNHERKTISIQSGFELTSVLHQPNLDSLVAYCQDIQYTRLTSSSVSYDFVFENHEYERIRMVFHPDTYVIESFTFYQADPVSLTEGGALQSIRMEIQFSNIQINQALPDAQFSEAQFVSHINGQYQPVKALASYRLVNFLSNNQ